MRTYASSVGKINAHTLPTIIDWLRKHDIPYDEIHVGKPWCGTDGFYVDDRSIRPEEFRTLGYDQIRRLLHMDGAPGDQ
jgi:capsule biosynthesis phosphatase